MNNFSIILLICITFLIKFLTTLLFTNNVMHIEGTLHYTNILNVELFDYKILLNVVVNI